MPSVALTCSRKYWLGLLAVLLLASPVLADTVDSIEDVDRLSNRFDAKREDFVPDANSIMLDHLLADHNYAELGNRMMHPAEQALVLPTLNWARTRALGGSSLIVPLMYAEMLWAISAPNPNLDKARETSSFMVAYALLIARADGVKCADPTAPTHHIDMILNRYRPQFEFLAHMQDDKKNNIIQRAVALEAKNARLRENDNYLCRFGLQEAQASLKKYNEANPAPSKDGQVGKTVELPYDPNFQPQFLSGDIWGQKQVEERTHFKDLLTSLTDHFKSPPTTPPVPANTPPANIK
jgi:hypothetical protein